MTNFVLSPNMSLPVPVVGVDPGPDYANNINSSLTILDQHDHTPGSGVQITPSGLNINSSLPMNNNSLTSTAAITYQIQGTDPASYSSYMKGVDFYLKDGSGNVIRLTQSGSVAGASGTITGLPSGTASASYAAGVFTFQSATATSANIDGGSFVLRNNTANSKGLTLQPPNAMSADYSITLPSLPLVKSYVTIDTSGNMGTANLNNYQISSSCGTFGTIAGSYVDVTNLSVTIITGGRPIFVGLVSTGSGSYIGGLNITTGQANCLVRITDNAASTVYVENSIQIITNPNSAPSASIQLPVSSVFGILALASGTYTFKVQISSVSATIIQANLVNAQLVAYEI